MQIKRQLIGWLLGAALAAPIAVCAMPRPVPAPQPQPQKKDYLTDDEADQIRDAFAPNAKIKLFVQFAADRIKKIQYELAHLDPADRRQGERINDLLNGYAGCIDDGDGYVDIAVEKQQDVHESIKIFTARANEFLTYLQSLGPKTPLLDDYKENLDDAIEGTQDALRDAEKAKKKAAPPPVRRKT